MLRILQSLLILFIALIILGSGVAIFHENILDWWARRNLTSKLSEALGAEVQIDGFSWSDGIMRADKLQISGGTLPFSSVHARNIQVPATWKSLLRFNEKSLDIEVEEASVVLRLESEASATNARPSPKSDAPHPDFDILITKFSAEYPAPRNWTITSSEARILHNAGLWSFAITGGAFSLSGFPPLQIERISIEQQNGNTTLKSFALHDATNGVFAGSATKPKDGQWSGEISWQDIALAPIAGESFGTHFSGKGSGDASFKNGALRGRIKIADAETRQIPGLVQLAGIFTGEDWSSIPWETLSFSFERQNSAQKTLLRDFVALSSKGLAVRGEGTFAADALQADLHLGVLNKNRPWLIAFVPALFRNENDGYFWTPVRIAGTPAAPTEDLSARVVAAAAAAPANAAIKAATEAPKPAIEAAGQLLRGLFR